MFCMESGSKSGKLWLAPLIEPKPNRERSDAMAPYRINTVQGTRYPGTTRTVQYRVQSVS
jgi:hypothetical protein